jgi:hypothetical protein
MTRCVMSVASSGAWCLIKSRRGERQRQGISRISLVYYDQKHDHTTLNLARAHIMDRATSYNIEGLDGLV